MFYQYFNLINWIFAVFGLKKPLISSSGKPSNITLWDKSWSIIIILAIIGSFSVSISATVDWNIKNNLENISKVNCMIINVIVILCNLNNGENICGQLYSMVENILSDFKFSKRCIKMISVKMYLWFSLPTVIFLVFIILEIIHSDPPFCFLLTEMPTFLSVVHLELHLYILLSILKVINSIMSKLLTFEVNRDSFIQKLPKKSRTLKYLFNPDVNFIEVNQKERFDLKLLCRVYDDLCTCIQLLEEHHGFQMLTTIWLIFSSAVIGITQIICKQAKFPLLVIARSVLPFLWCFIGCYIDDQMRKEVDQTDTLIVKHLIDFRCDQPRRSILQTFKQVVNNNRLQFTASSLFHLNYAMILGTVMNIITYSIILIQLFISET